MSGRRGCIGTCGSFWNAQGYGDPITVATSVLLPDLVLILFRIAAFIGTMTVLVYYTVVRLLNLQYLSVITLGGSGVCYGLAAVACGVQKRWLAKLVTTCYHVFFSFAILITPVYWLLEFPGDYVTLHRLYPHGIVIVLFIADILLGGQLEFRVFDLFWVLFYGIAYIIFMYVRFAITSDFPYGFLDYRDVGVLRSLITLAILVAAGLFVAFLLVIFSRITRLYRKKSGSSSTAKPETTHA